MSVSAVFCPYGPVQSHDGLYLHRDADQRLLDLCLAHRYAYVLTSRQVGKSSLLWATVQRLRQGETAVAVVDLQQIGSHISSDQWYQSVLHLVKKLGLKVQVSSWWKEHETLAEPQRFHDFFREVVLVQIQKPIVIFFDEIDITFNLPFRDDFFAAIRAMYHSRGREPDFERLSFVLVGAATPNDLVSDASRSPFNIGEEVLLEDFSFQQARPLAAGLKLDEPHAEQLLQWILDWSKGHPYLTQTLCIRAAQANRPQWTRPELDQLVSDYLAGMESRQDIHFGPIRKRLLDDKALLRAYGAILRRPVSFRKRNQHHLQLELLGLIRHRDGQLSIRNPLYRRVFHKAWVKENLEVDWQRLLRQMAVIFLPAIFVLLFVWYAIVLRARLERESLLSEQKDQALASKNQALELKDQALQDRATALRNLEARQRDLEEKTQALQQALALGELKQQALEVASTEARAAREREASARIDAERERQRATLEAEALALLLKGQIQEAADTLDKTLAFSPDQALTRERIGDLFRTNGDYAKAATYYQLASELYRQQDDNTGLMRSLLQIAEMKLFLGDYHQTARLAEQALTLNQAGLAPKAHYLLAQKFFQEAFYPQATEQTRLALEGDPQDAYVVAAHLMLARLDYHRGLHEKALAEVNEVLLGPPLESNWETRATALHLKANIMQQLAKFHEANRFHLEALEFSREANDRDREKAGLFFLAQLAFQLGYQDEGRNQALKFLENPRSRKPVEALYDLARTGMVNGWLGYPDEARAQLTEAKAGLEQLGNRQMLAAIHLAAGDQAWRTGHLAEALTRFQQALGETRQNGNHAGLIQTYRKLAALYLAMDRTIEAENLYTEAIAEVRARGSVVDELLLLTDFGSMFRFSDSGPAQAMFANVVTIHQDLYQTADAGFRADLAEIAVNAYDARLVEHLYQDRIPQAYNSAEEARFFTSLGRYGQQAHLLLDEVAPTRSWLNLPGIEKEPGTIKPAQSQDSLAELQQRLPADAGVLAFYMMQDQGFAFLVTRDQLYWEGLRGELYLTPLIQPPALYRPLYRNLILPFETRLKKIKRIAIIPHGILLALPETMLTQWSQRLSQLNPDQSPPQLSVFASSADISFPDPALYNEPEK